MNYLGNYRNHKQFNDELGWCFRIFRTKVLKKSLKELGGETLVPSLSNFETGKLYRYEYIYYYVKACQTKEQLQALVDLISQCLNDAWDREQREEEDNDEKSKVQ